MTRQPLAELKKAAVEQVKKHPSIAAENLTVKETTSLTVADPAGHRLIHVRVNKPAPKPPAGGGIVPVIAGGTGFWEYEVAMTPAGKAVSFGRRLKGFCLSRGTPVATPEGDVPVERLRGGQQVWAFDGTSGTTVPATVIAVLSSQAEETILLNGRLRLTADHPVYAARGGNDFQWVTAAALRPGDVLRPFDGQGVAVKTTEIVRGRVDVYDVAVDGPHNFFAAGILVHNKSIAWTPQAFVPWYALWNRAPEVKTK